MLMPYKIEKKLEKLKHYDICEKEKTRFIKNLYKLAYISYELYIEESQTNETFKS